MAGLTRVGKFLLLLALALAGLRLAHVGAGVVYPPALTGRISLGDALDIEHYAGFRPWLPFFRPISTGPEKPEIAVTRRGIVSVEVEWRGDRRLVVTMIEGDEPPPHPADAPGIAGEPESARWTAEDLQHALVRRGPLWILVTTDLPERDAIRVARTLRER